jgi:hypothetical protein
MHNFSALHTAIASSLRVICAIESGRAEYSRATALCLAVGGTRLPGRSDSAYVCARSVLQKGWIKTRDSMLGPWYLEGCEIPPGNKRM